MATVEIDEIREVQARLDSALAPVGLRAPEPIGGQSPLQYLAYGFQTVKRQCLPKGHKYRVIQYDELPADQPDVLKNLGQQCLQACVDARNDPSTVPYGEFRELPYTDRVTGHKGIRFVGQDHFTRFMGRPGRRVVSFGVVRENVANYNRGAERMREVVAR